LGSNIPASKPLLMAREEKAEVPVRSGKLHGFRSLLAVPMVRALLRAGGCGGEDKFAGVHVGPAAVRCWSWRWSTVPEPETVNAPVPPMAAGAAEGVVCGVVR